MNDRRLHRDVAGHRREGQRDHRRRPLAGWSNTTRAMAKASSCAARSRRMREITGLGHAGTWSTKDHISRKLKAARSQRDLRGRTDESTAKTPAPAPEQSRPKSRFGTNWKRRGGETKPTPTNLQKKPKRIMMTPADGAAAPAQVPPPQQQKEAPDIWESAPPDLKAAHDAQVKALESATTEHARRSIEGRISAYTRRLKERNEAAAQQPAAARKKPLIPSRNWPPNTRRSLSRFKRSSLRSPKRFHSSTPTMKSRQEAADPADGRRTQGQRRLLEEPASRLGWLSARSMGPLSAHGLSISRSISARPLSPIRTRSSIPTVRSRR